MSADFYDLDVSGEACDAKICNYWFSKITIVIQVKFKKVNYLSLAPGAYILDTKRKLVKLIVEIAKFLQYFLVPIKENFLSAIDF